MTIAQDEDVVDRGGIDPENAVTIYVDRIVPPADPAPGTHQPGPAVQTGDQRYPAAGTVSLIM